ncbi:MAG: hypothetical protein CYPHOPRED_004336, partial [Cyphobasidiales sp. Tagirdzhanova-0007]
MVVAVAAPTISPYLNALQAAITQHPAKIDNSIDDDDPCFVCGRPIAAGLAYCSDECRDQDHHPSPMLSPAPTALPALVSSRRREHKSDRSSPPSSATSSPSKIGEGEDEEDIEKLILPPPVGSYSKKNTFNYNYAYGLATSPAVVRSFITSPSAHPTHMQRQSSTQSQHPGTLTGPITSPSLGPSEVITFRRRPQPDSLNGTQTGTAMSPALLARRRPSSHASKSPMFGASKSPICHAQSSRAVAPLSSVTAAPRTSRQEATVTLRNGFTAFNTLAQQTCARHGCPVASQPMGPSFLRRVSDPHSPYASPRAQSKSRNTFEASFTAERGSSICRIPDSGTATLRRPSFSATMTAPPMVSLASKNTSSANVQDYAGFAGFLATVHNNGRIYDMTAASNNKESGYEAHDELVRGRKRQLKNSTTKDALYMKPSKSGNLAQPSSSSSSSECIATPSKPNHFLSSRGAAFKTSSVAPTPVNAMENGQTFSSSSEGEGPEHLGRTAAAAWCSKLLPSAQQPLRPRHNHSTSVGEGSQYIVTIRPIEKTVSSARAGIWNNHGTAGTSALASSSSEEEEEEEETLESDCAARPEHSSKALSKDDNERGRTRSKRPSSIHRQQLVSPFTALERISRGMERRSDVEITSDDARGRSRQRR